MVTGVNTKLLVTMDENGNLIVDPLMEDLITKNNWKLIRESDGLIKQSAAIKWLEWNEQGRVKATHSEPAVGFSLIMSPFGMSFTWQTTNITKIVEQRDGYIKFNTENSTYELFKL